MKYIGFTTTKLNKRLAGHQANIIQGSEGHIMMEHFTKHHAIMDMVIKPIDICDGEVLRKREQFWMQQLNTIFPYGLNSRIDIEGIHDAYDHVKSGNRKPIYKTFNTIKNSRTHRGSGKNSTRNKMYKNNPINTNENFNNDNIFNPAIFVSSITDNIAYSVAKDSRKLIMILRLPQIVTLFIYVSNLLLPDTTIYVPNLLLTDTTIYMYLTYYFQIQLYMYLTYYIQIQLYMYLTYYFQIQLYMYLTYYFQIQLYMYLTYYLQIQLYMYLTYYLQIQLYMYLAYYLQIQLYMYLAYYLQIQLYMY